METQQTITSWAGYYLRLSPPSGLLVSLLAGGLLLSSVDAQAGSKSGDPRIFGPDTKLCGLSYPEWHVAWWQWALDIPGASNPLLNADDPEDWPSSLPCQWMGTCDASIGQSGHVWFLAGTCSCGWTVVRDAVIPSGVALCFPLQNRIAWGWPIEQEAQFEPFLRYLLDLTFDDAVVTCEIDGVPVRDLAQYRHQSPTASLLLDGDDIMPWITPGEYRMLDEGYYLILKPLPVGEHTIHWTGGFPSGGLPESGPQDVTYHITVVP